MSNKEALSNKTLTMLVGPSAIGKSAIMEAIIQQNSDFAYVRSFTTRQPRVGEKSHYTFIDKNQAEELLENGQALTYSVHPTTLDIYGSTLASYPKRHNLLDTLSGSVGEFRSLGFEHTTTLAIAAAPEQWRNWFTSRYPEPTPEAEKRLGEAALSINWALQDPEACWLVNEEGALEKIAQRAIAVTIEQRITSSVPDEPYAMLELIDKGMWNH